MEEFPFTAAEWERVRAAAWPRVNATWAGDEILSASAFVTLQEVLHDLRAKYGDHPILLETEADFADHDVESKKLYRAAIAIADTHGLPTLSIRLSLARLLLQTGETDGAITELSACARELPHADDWQREDWLDMIAEVSSCDELPQALSVD